MCSVFSTLVSDSFPMSSDPQLVCILIPQLLTNFQRLYKSHLITNILMCIHSTPTCGSVWRLVSPADDLVRLSRKTSSIASISDVSRLTVWDSVKLNLTASRDTIAHLLCDFSIYKLERKALQGTLERMFIVPLFLGKNMGLWTTEAITMYNALRTCFRDINLICVLENVII